MAEGDLSIILSPPLLLTRARLAPECFGCGVSKLAWVETFDTLDALEDALDDAPVETAVVGLEDALVDAPRVTAEAAEIDDDLDSAIGDCFAVSLLLLLRAAVEVVFFDFLDANEVKAFGREEDVPEIK